MVYRGNNQQKASCLLKCEGLSSHGRICDDPIVTYVSVASDREHTGDGRLPGKASWRPERPLYRPPHARLPGGWGTQEVSLNA